MKRKTQDHLGKARNGQLLRKELKMAACAKLLILPRSEKIAETFFLFIRLGKFQTYHILSGNWCGEIGALKPH